jgi:hypothetical protein
LWLVSSPSMSASIFPCHEYSSFIGFMACTFKTGFEAFFLASNIFSKFYATCLLWTFGFKFLSPSRATVLTKHSFFSFWILINTQSAGNCSPSEIKIRSPALISCLNVSTTLILPSGLPVYS